MNTGKDVYTDSGTLCRIATDKLSEDSSENIKNREVIASDVVIGSYQCTADNTVFYQTADDTLYYYDNNQTTMLASQVSNYNTNYTGYIIYYTQNYRYDIDQDITYNLYVTDLKDLQNPVLLSSDMPSYSSVYVYGDDFLLYPEYYTSGSISLFRYNFTGEIEKIADDVAEYNRIFSDDKIYFLAYNGRVYNLYQKIYWNTILYISRWNILMRRWFRYTICAAIAIWIKNLQFWMKMFLM